MTMLSAWPAMVITGIAILIFSIKPPFQFLDSAPTSRVRRLDTIDGIRGVLASMVFFHHFVIGNYNRVHGTSGMPPSLFYPFVGPAAVGVFFMITGFLFWGRLLDQQTPIKWAELFINRMFRIYPLYLLLILAYFGAVYVRVGIPANQSFEGVVSQVSQWLAFGAIRLPPPFLGAPQYIRLVGQTWSLHYEWLFYLSLPALAIIARERSAIALTAGALLINLLCDNVINRPTVFFIDFFLIGMLTVSVLRSFPALKGDGVARSAIAVAAVAMAISMSDHAYSTSATVLMGVFFFLIASGTSLFGILNTTGAKRLGNISYSIYLLQGFVAAALMSVPRLKYHVGYSDHRFWIVALAIYISLIAVSAMAYCFVEKRGIDLGRSIIRAASRKRITGPSDQSRAQSSPLSK